MARAPWMVSMHGGHSFPFCDHAMGALEDTVEAAEEAGFRVYGLTEHAPRLDDRFLYPTERARGWNAARLAEHFDEWAELSAELLSQWRGETRLLRGIEVEVVPAQTWLESVRALVDRHRLDYVVGAVHHVREIPIDGNEKDFARAVEAAGGVERLAVEFYKATGEMVTALKPEVVAHFDLIRLRAARVGKINTPSVREAARAALRAVQAAGSMLEVGAGALRRGWRIPYPAPWVLEMALELGVPLTLGDGSHAVFEVGDGMDALRTYLLARGVETVHFLDRAEDGRIVRKSASLEPPLEPAPGG
ncbi:MAG: histidinol-phosphatase HisJ family protein [Deltaproteobacteria bacterium]|nr:MAG: histidinol-phosphatase HisJ family protein [Deltaproteobacteria bacterium]